MSSRVLRADKGLVSISCHLFSVFSPTPPPLLHTAVVLLYCCIIIVLYFVLLYCVLFYCVLLVCSLVLLAYHSAIRPLLSLDGPNITAGVSAGQLLLSELQPLYPSSPLLCYFGGRLKRLQVGWSSVLPFVSAFRHRLLTKCSHGSRIAEKTKVEEL